MYLHLEREREIHQFPPIYPVQSPHYIYTYIYIYVYKNNIYIYIFTHVYLINFLSPRVAVAPLARPATSSCVSPGGPGSAPLSGPGWSGMGLADGMVMYTCIKIDKYSDLHSLHLCPWLVDLSLLFLLLCPVWFLGWRHLIQRGVFLAAIRGSKTTLQFSVQCCWNWHKPCSKPESVAAVGRNKRSLHQHLLVSALWLKKYMIYAWIGYIYNYIWMYI